MICTKGQGGVLAAKSISHHHCSVQHRKSVGAHGGTGKMEVDRAAGSIYVWKTPQ